MMASYKSMKCNFSICEFAIAFNEKFLFVDYPPLCFNLSFIHMYNLCIGNRVGNKNKKGNISIFALFYD